MRYVEEIKRAKESRFQKVVSLVDAQGRNPDPDAFSGVMTSV